MKVTPEHYDVIHDAVAVLDTEEVRTAYRAGNFPRADKVQDLNKRYRWDLFYAARPPYETTRDYTDAHLYTALSKIVPALT